MYVRFLILEQQLCHEIQQTDDDKIYLANLAFVDFGTNVSFLYCI